MNGIFTAIGNLLVWIGYGPLFHRSEQIPKEFVKGLLVQPVLLPELANLSCYGPLSKKGTEFVAAPFFHSCDSRQEDQLGKDLHNEVLPWRRYQQP